MIRSYLDSCGRWSPAGPQQQRTATICMPQQTTGRAVHPQCFTGHPWWQGRPHASLHAVDETASATTSSAKELLQARSLVQHTSRYLLWYRLVIQAFCFCGKSPSGVGDNVQFRDNTHCNSSFFQPGHSSLSVFNLRPVTHGRGVNEQGYTLDQNYHRLHLHCLVAIVVTEASSGRCMKHYCMSVFNTRKDFLS